jgi:hypothetical protein
MWLCSSSTSIIEDRDPLRHLNILTRRHTEQDAGEFKTGFAGMAASARWGWQPLTFFHLAYVRIAKIVQEGA